MGKDFDIEKLKGHENYHTWCFAIKNVLQCKGLSKCITDPTTETDQEKQNNCKAFLALSVVPSLYVHITRCDTALKIWTTLKNLYEDKGLCRKIGLLRNLISCKLEDSESMQSYIDNISDNANKLNGIGFNISEEWLTAIILAGLTDAYKPFIMGIEAADSKITSGAIVAKLLDSESSPSAKGDVFLAKKRHDKWQNSQIKKKCTTCGKKHAGECRYKKNHGHSGNAKNAFTALLTESNKNEWYIDSGASSHMTPNEKLLTSKKNSLVDKIMSANGTAMNVNCVGKTSLNINDQEIEINEILHVPELSVNLLSAAKIVSQGNEISFNSKGCTILNKHKEVIAQCKQENGVYKLKGIQTNCFMSKQTKNTAMLWHRRLGHTNFQTLKKMRDGAVTGIEFDDDDREIKQCEICPKGKQTRIPFKPSSTKTTQLLELIHSDLCGPMETQSIGHAKYLLTFIDDHSKKVFVYFLKSKSEVLDSFKTFKNYIECQTGLKIKTLRTDNGGEYCSNEFNRYCKVNGIQHQLSTAYTPQQNGVAERMNRSLIEKAKCLLFDADLPKCYWAEATNMAAYLINKSVSSSHEKIPDEIFYKKRVDMSNLKLFGCKAMVHINKEKRKKLDSKSTAAIFVGYDDDIKGFRCINTKTRKLIISRDVIFFEKTPAKLTINLCNDEVREIERSDESSAEIDGISPDESKPDIQNDTEDNTMIESPSLLENDPDYEPDETLRIEPQQRTLRSQNKVNVPSFKLTNFAFLSQPATPSEAINSEEWKVAMDEEIKSHRLNNTWSLVKLPNGRKPIKAKWVFKIKQNDVDEDIKCKARLVAKGCSQKYGIDYNETFSPVVRYNSIRFLMALAVKNGYKIHQMDVVTAFLQGDLNEEIYMEQPECYDDGTKRVCKLHKSVYGLKQAGRQWNLKLDAALKEHNLKRCETDPCVYFEKDLKIIIAIYVDDFIILYKNSNDLDELMEFLNKKFNMKDLGPVKNCLGIRINQSKNGEEITMDQSAYIQEILKRFGMLDCKPVGTPRETSQKLSENNITEENNLVGKIPYQEAVGSLLYLAQATRPDIAFAVNDVSRFNLKHTNEHWQAVKRIFRYLKGTSDYRLCYKKNKDTRLQAFSDADWAAEIDGRRSCSGYVIKMSNGAISWCSKRQPIVALSSTEAEYIALSSTVREVIWIRMLAKEVDANFGESTIVYCDNQSSIKLASSEAYRPRTKHIDIRYHHIRNKVDDGTIVVKHCSTHDMTADSLTKAVSKEKTKFCAEEMSLLPAK